jgi:hypothetical protein
VRTLFISSSIGLGHAGRDLAIANELRRLRPDVEIDWLAGDPATRLLEQAGERLLPECSVLRETGVAEASAGDFSLNLVGYVTHAARQWARVARTILRLIDRNGYEFVVGDETYELTIGFALRPALKTVPFAIIYDFFGVDAMSRNPFEPAAVHTLNNLWGGGRRGKAPPSTWCCLSASPRTSPIGRSARVCPIAVHTRRVTSPSSGTSSISTRPSFAATDPATARRSDTTSDLRSSARSGGLRLEPICSASAPTPTRTC